MQFDIRSFLEKRAKRPIQRNFLKISPQKILMEV